MSRKRPVLTGRGGESERRSDLHRYDSASGHIKRRGPPPLGEGPRESSGDLLSRARGPGTIGDEGLDFRVRKGNGYDPLSVTAETMSRRQLRAEKALSCTGPEAWRIRAAHAAAIEPDR